METILAVKSKVHSARQVSADTVSRLAKPVRTEIASSSDSGSLDKQIEETIKDPMVSIASVLIGGFHGRWPRIALRHGGPRTAH